MKNFIKIAFLLTMSFLTHTSLSVAIPTDPIGDDGTGSAVWIHFLQARTSNGVIKVGKPVEILWATSNAFACSVNSNAGGQQVPVNGSLFITPASKGEMMVTLTCVHQQGTQTSESVSFEVKGARFPELLDVSLNPSTSIPAGQSVTLTWNSEFTQYCELEGTHNDILESSGSESFTIIPGTNEFRITCYRAPFINGTILESNTIVKFVNGSAPVPIITNFYIQRLQSTYTLFWSSNSDYCLLDNVWNVPSNGGQSFQAVPYPVNHTLTCYRDGFLENSFITYYP